MERRKTRKGERVRVATIVKAVAMKSKEELEMLLLLKWRASLRYHRKNQNVTPQKMNHYPKLTNGQANLTVPDSTKF